MFQKMFTLASCLSALALSGLVFLWIRSYAVQDTIYWTSSQARGGVNSALGYISYAAYRVIRPMPIQFEYQHMRPVPPLYRRPHPWLAIRHTDPSSWDGTIPDWLLSTLAAVLPVCWCISRVRRGRSTSGRGAFPVVSSKEGTSAGGAPAADAPIPSDANGNLTVKLGLLSTTSDPNRKKIVWDGADVLLIIRRQPG